MRQRFAAIPASASLLAMLVTAVAAEPSTLPPCVQETSGPYRVIGVPDAETIVLDGGREVRLIGALAPDPHEHREAALAARQAVERLVQGRSVRLGYAKGARKRDRYGRDLAQVTLAPHERAQGDSLADDSDVWVQRMLIHGGYAQAYALPGQASCIGALMETEREAREATRGGWSQGLFRVMDAVDVNALMQSRGKFAIVEGRVVNTARAQRTVYINFGSDWRRDFTASLPAAVVERAAGGAGRVAALAGQRIRVRGWIELRNGPMITLDSLDEIETVAAASALSSGEEK